MGSEANAPAKRERPRFRLSVAQLLAMLLATVILILGAVATVLLLELRTSDRAAIHKALVDVAQRVTVALDRELARWRTLLETVAQSDHVGRGDWAGLHAFATRAVSANPGSAIAAVTTEGQMLLRTGVPFGTELPNVWNLGAQGKTAPWQSAILPLGAQDLTKTVLATRAPAYSNLYAGVATVTPRVSLAIPVIRAGEPVLVLTFSFSPDATLRPLLIETQGTDYRIAVIDRAGVVIVTNDKTVQKTGDAVSQSLWNIVGRGGAGMTHSRSATGEPMLIGYATSATSGWVVRVSRPVEAAYRGMNVAFAVWSTACAAVLILACVVAWAMSRRIAVPLRVLAQSLEWPLEVRKAGLPPSGIREIDTLSAASAAAAASEIERDNDRVQRLLAEQQALKAAEKEHWLRVVLNNLFVFVAVLDTEGCLIEVNQAPLDLAGLSRDEVIGRPFWECRCWNGDIHAQEKVRAAIGRAAAGETVRYDTAVRVKDGSRMTVDFQVAPVVGSDGAIRYLVASGVDVTQRMETERALREAGERKNEFIAMLSHELRNPLAPIMTSLALLADAGASAEVQRKARDILQRQVAHLARLVNDLMDVNRFKRGKVMLQKQVVDLCELVRNAVDDYRGDAARRRLRLQLACEPDAILVHADAARITQAIKNLLDNAMKHTAPGGGIEVALDAHGREAVLTVCDTGEGIRPELLASIFEPFVQGGAPVGSALGGLGLGLALVKDIIESHGGSVGVASEGLGRGATFIVRLPITREPEVAAVPAAPDAVAGRRRILVVDDNADSAEALALLLKTIGYEAEAVTSGEAALRRVAGDPPDLVICDIGMPSMDGYAVARALKRDHPELPLIALTGFAQEEDLRRAFDAGFGFHIAKPVNPAALAAAVEQALRPYGDANSPAPDSP